MNGTKDLTQDLLGVTQNNNTQDSDHNQGPTQDDIHLFVYQNIHKPSSHISKKFTQ